MASLFDLPCISACVSLHFLEFSLNSVDDVCEAFHLNFPSGVCAGSGDRIAYTRALVLHNPTVINCMRQDRNQSIPACTPSLMPRTPHDGAGVIDHLISSPFT